MEPTKITDVFFSLDNPAIYALIFIVIIVVVIIFIKNNFIEPLARRKVDLEIKNAQVMALFATMDPDPILRIDMDLKVIEANNAAQDLFDSYKLIGKDIKALIPDYQEIIESYSSFNNTISIEDKYYSLVIKDVQHLNFTQLYMHDVTKRVKHDEIVLEYQKSLKKLRIKVEEAHEEEKQIIGRELHDSVGQQLSALKYSVETAIQQGKIKGKEEDIKSLLHQMDEISQEVREISHQLRPRILNEVGLKDALTSLVANITENTEIMGYVVCNGKEFGVEKNLELNIYRICQEAVNNIIKHSGCTEFGIKLYFEENNFSVIITDNGRGFDLDKDLDQGSSSLGLLNMKERAEAFNGSFFLELADGEGVTIYLNFIVGERTND